MPHQFSVNLTPVLPAWAVASVAAALLLLLLQGSLQLLRKQVPPKWVAALAGLRTLIVVFLVLCLLQPALSYSRATERLPDLLVLIDTSQSMGIKASADGGTRLDGAIAALRRGDMLGHLRERFNVHWFAFDRDASPIEEGDVNGLKPTGDSTRFATSLATAVAYGRQGESAGGGDAATPVRALLVSDGEETGEGDDVTTRVRSLGVPVDTLAPEVADAPAPPRAAKIVFANVQVPRSVKIGSEMQVAVALRIDGGAGPIPAGRQLQLLEEGQTVASQDVAFAPGESEKVLRLSHRPASVGLRAYELRLAGGADAPAFRFTLAVADETNQVLVLEDSWRWELKFLRRVVEDDPSFSFTAFLSRTGGGGMHVQLTEADRKVTLAGFPQGADDLSWFDTIVLGDVDPRRWPPQLAAAVARAVEDEGKSLVVIAGPNLAKLAEVPELRELLPVDVTAESAVPVEGPIEVRPTPEGAASPFFFKLAGASLPELDRVYPPLRKRPAATILLEARRQANAYGSLIVMAEHTVGRGRVLYIGTDALWNWQMAGPLDPQGVTPYATFWQQALRALSPPHPRAGNVSLALQPDRTRYQVGQRVTVTARYASAEPLAAPVIQGNITLPDQKQVPLALAPDPTQPNTYRAEFEPTLPGPYRITGAIGSHGKPAAADALVAIDVEPPPGEMTSAGINHANLARIADATHGHRLNPSDPSTWPTPGIAERYPIREAYHVDLWGNLSLLVVLSALLGLDWLLRLVRGYT